MDYGIHKLIVYIVSIVLKKIVIWILIKRHIPADSIKFLFSSTKVLIVLWVSWSIVRARFRNNCYDEILIRSLKYKVSIFVSASLIVWDDVI